MSQAVKQYTTADLRRSLRESTRPGISTAEYYVKELASQFGNEEAAHLFCASKAVRWSVAIKQARSETTFHHKDMGPTPVDDMVIDQGTKIAKGCYAEYTATIGSKDKDWDGDIVDPYGYDFDMKAPSLWMHAHGMPVGSLKWVDPEDPTQCRFKVADIPLGRDACKLIQAGALRKSIGFKPLEFEPLGFKKNKEGKDVPDGWHVKKCKILEVSMVSVPANSKTAITALDCRKSYEKEIDAIRTVAGKGFEDDRLKHWGKTFLDARPTVVSGWSPEKTSQALAKKTLEILEKSVAELRWVDADAPDLNSETVQKYYGIDGYMPASMEDRCSKVASAVSTYCRKNPDVFGGGDCYCYPIATYSELAYVACRDWSKDTRRYYQVDYSVDANGAIMISGAKEIQFTPVVSPVGDDGKTEMSPMVGKLEQLEKAYKSSMTESHEVRDSDVISDFRKAIATIMLGDEFDTEFVKELRQTAESIGRLHDFRQLRALV